MSSNIIIKKNTAQTLLQMKKKCDKISMLTAYDFSLAKLVDEAGIDAILVGDSAANVMAGHETTLPITLDQMIYHAQSVVRAVKKAMVIVDLPFGSYQSNSTLALESAIRVMKETGAQAVKLEGGEEIIDSIKKIIAAGIPVMGHLGLTPQSVNHFGGFGLRAKEEKEAKRLEKDVQILAEAGCFSIVLEKIPSVLAKKIAASVDIPIIGIGAGAEVDGQILVLHDMLGINNEFHPKFVRKYLDLQEQITHAIGKYIQDVKNIHFPDESESY